LQAVNCWFGSQTVSTRSKSDQFSKPNLKPELRKKRKKKQIKTNTKKIPIYFSKGEARLLIKVQNCPTLLWMWSA
jgi:hypothetical protein